MSRKKKSANTIHTENEQEGAAYILGPKKDKELQAKTPGQQIYIDTVRSNSITLCSGVYGTGKSFISIAIAVEYLKANKIEKIIISRPAISACGEDQGFYPGDYQQKLEPFMLPLLEEMRHFVSPQEIKKWIETEKLRLMPISLLRGHNWNNSFVVIDECANLTFDQILLILTRFGKNSKLVMSGDFEQSDLPPKQRGAFEDFFEILDGAEGIGLCHLGMEDIVRSPFTRMILERVDKWKEENDKPAKYY